MNIVDFFFFFSITRQGYIEEDSVYVFSGSSALEWQTSADPRCEIKDQSTHDHSSPHKSFIHFRPLPSAYVSCPLTSALPWCSQGPLARSRLMSVNHSRVSAVAVATTTPVASLAPACPVSRDTGAKSTLTSAKSGHARTGLGVSTGWMSE